MKEKFIRFMQGRYGTDQLNKMLLIVTLVCIVLSMFFHSAIFEILILALLILLYFRMFSRNIPKRYAENQKYLAMTAGLRSKFLKKKNEASQLKDYHIYKCPNCKQKIRIPRGRGKIMVRCPKCGTEFMKKS